MNTRKITAVLLSMVFILAVIFSVYFISAETDHDCSGEECAVCFFIHQCETGISQMDSAAAVIVLPILIGLFFLLLPTHLDAVLLRTLISEKIRLNN